MSKWINVNCQNVVDCQFTQKSLKINFKFKIQVTASKPITSALIVVKDNVIKYSETAFSNSNVNYFGFIKTPPRSSKSGDCVTFWDLKYLLSTFHL